MFRSAFVFGLAILLGSQSFAQKPATAKQEKSIITPVGIMKNIPDSVLLETVQRQTFRYFWNFGHPVSGLARERDNSGDIVTSGGSGFGIMAIIAGIDRSFITR